MEYTNKLSICMMVKNEEKYLDRTLSSLKPLFDSMKAELIIVDTGSEDTTVEIAKKYTNKVFFHEWNNNFGEMRNKTISYATGEWILVIDGDEVFQDLKPLIDFLNSSDSKKYNAGIITIKNLIREDNEDMSGTVDMVRLFRHTQDFHYLGAIHEQPQFKEPIFFTKCVALHYGYLSTDQELMELKFKRNTELLERELEKDPENIYYWFQLSQSYGMYKDFKKSLEHNLKAYQIAKKNKINLKERMYIYTHLAHVYYLNDKYKELEPLCLEALKVEDGHIDLYYYLGKAQRYLRKNKEAVKSYKEYLKILEEHRKSKKTKGASLTKTSLEFYEDVYLDLCILYKEMERNEDALKYANKITKKYMLKPALPHLVELYITTGKYEDLYNKYTEILKDASEIKQEFWMCLEQSKSKLEEEKKDTLTQIFSRENSSYGILNRVRIHINNKNGSITIPLLDEIKNLDFEGLPVFFADIIYLMIENLIPVGQALYNLREYIIQAHVEYLSNNYKDLSGVVFAYLDKITHNSDLDEIRVQKVLMKSLLILDQVDSKQYRLIWDRYLKEGTSYITKVYSPFIIEKERIYDIKNDEEAFLVYILLARKHREKDQLLYVKYLRKALKVYPSMKKGIEILIKEIESEDTETNSAKQDEFEALKETVKKNINILLETNQALEAKGLIDEYLKIVPKDLEMLVLKSQVLLSIN